MHLKEAIELRISDICNEKGITMNKLATICGITQSTLANLRVRPKSNISTITILRICRGLNITIEEFLMTCLKIIILKMIKVITMLRNIVITSFFFAKNLLT